MNKGAEIVKLNNGRYVVKTDLGASIEEISYPSADEARQAMNIWLISGDDKIVPASDGNTIYPDLSYTRSAGYR